MTEERVSLVETGKAIESLRNSDFDTVSAVGEVIDNSLQAEAKNINMATEEKELSAQGRRKAGKKQIIKIAFGDDGYGMDNNTLHHCMQLGYSSRYNDRSGIGRFGVGMTLAAINQCKKIEVYSKVSGGAKWRYTFVDLDKSNSEIPKPVETDLPEGYNVLVGKDSGTLVIWSKCDRLSGASDEISEWVARTYRKFIGTQIVNGGKIVENSKPITISLNGQEIKAFDPLFATPNELFPGGTTAELFEPIVIDDMPIPDDADVREKKSTIIITMSLTPKEWRMKGGGTSGSSDLAKKLNISENEGFSILRAGREVFYDVMPRFKPPVHGDGIDRWWSAEICFDPVFDHYFSVKNIKRGARFIIQLREKIQEKMEPTIKECRRRIQERFKQTKLDELNDNESTSTEHTDAEEAVKKVSIPKPPQKEKKTKEEQHEEIKEVLKKILDESVLDEWAAKIEKQPCTIIDRDDRSWKGSTFIDIHPAGGQTVIEYNRAHDIFILIYDAIKALTECTPGSDSDAVINKAKILKAAIDLLLMAYAQAENLFGDHEQEQQIGDTLEFLRGNWGQVLRKYVQSYVKENGLC